MITKLPCKYQSFRCSGIYPHSCPYAGSECAVIGDIPSIVFVAHLKDDHKVDMHNGSTFNHHYAKSNPHEVENATWMLTVFGCFGQYFCLHFEAFQLGMAPIYRAFLRFMGDDNGAKNYGYSIGVGGNGRKMIWQGVPRSVRTVTEMSVIVLMVSLSNATWLDLLRGRPERIEAWSDRKDMERALMGFCLRFFFL